jgi:hypothetical protein
MIPFPFNFCSHSFSWCNHCEKFPGVNQSPEVKFLNGKREKILEHCAELSFYICTESEKSINGLISNKQLDCKINNDVIDVIRANDDDLWSLNLM